MIRNIIIVILFALVLLAGLAFAFGYGPFVRENRDEGAAVSVEDILSFEDCEAAGLPVMESYPRQCRTPDGRLFAEEIKVEPTYENASADLIVVDNPHPGGVTGKEFVIVGQARGQWFFEGSFPIEVIGADGNQIAGSFATAEGEWMTTDFVRFKSETLDLPSAYRGPATLILRRHNASGLPEHDASISIPIVVEY